MSNNPQTQHLDSAIIEEDDELIHHQTIDLPGKVRRRSSVRTGNSAFAVTPTAIATGSRRWSHTTGAGIEESSIDNLPAVSVNAHHEPAIKEEGDSSDSETVIDTDATSYKESTNSPESLSIKPTVSSLGINEHKPETSLSSPRGIAIITTCCASQFFDNQWVTSVNIALPMMASDLGIAQESMTWLVAAYTLTFGGFLLLSGVGINMFTQTILNEVTRLWLIDTVVRRFLLVVCYGCLYLPLLWVCRKAVSRLLFSVPYRVSEQQVVYLPRLV